MISVIVPHLDQPEQLRRCILSLLAQGGLKQEVEIIVVDNGSQPTPIEICSLFPGITLLHERTPGPGPARNLGVSRAKGDILAFIDADCAAHPGWLSEIERCFSEREDIGIIGGDVRIACQDPGRLTLLEAYESVFAFRMKEYIAKQGFTGTGNLAVRARILSAVGPFGGIQIAEDRDWGQRALRLGFRTHYCPHMIVFHPARKSLAEIARKWDRHVAHDFQRVRSEPGWWPRWILPQFRGRALPCRRAGPDWLLGSVAGLASSPTCLLGRDPHSSLQVRGHANLGVWRGRFSAERQMEPRVTGSAGQTSSSTPFRIDRQPVAWDRCAALWYAAMRAGT